MSDDTSMVKTTLIMQVRPSPKQLTSNTMYSLYINKDGNSYYRTPTKFIQDKGVAYSIDGGYRVMDVEGYLLDICERGKCLLPQFKNGNEYKITIEKIGGEGNEILL